MGYEITIIASYTTFFLVIVAAWVGGYLDGLQHSLQDVLLGKMGDNRASYGVKCTHHSISRSHSSRQYERLLIYGNSTALMSNRVVNDPNANAVQDGLGKDIGGLVGKGGIGESIGDTLSKGL